MTSYNRLNGKHCSESKELLDGILRGDWGWNGLIMSDWTGVYSVDESIKAGLDVEMPGPPVMRGSTVNRAFGAGKLTPDDVDDRVRNVLHLLNFAIDSGIPFYAGEDKVDTPELRALLREAAANATVLLKNDSGLLPLGASAKGKRIAVIGSNAKVAFPSGGGSASLAPSWVVSALDGITAAAEEAGASVDYAVGVAAFRYVPLLDPYLSHPTSGKQGARIQFFNGKPDERWFTSAEVPKSSKPDFELDTDTSLCFMIDGVPWDKLDKHVRARVRRPSSSSFLSVLAQPGLTPCLPAVLGDLHARRLGQVDLRPRLDRRHPALPRRQARRRERRVVQTRRALLQHGLGGGPRRGRARGGQGVRARAARLRRPGVAWGIAVHLLVVVPHRRLPDRRARDGAQRGGRARAQERPRHRRRRDQPGLGVGGVRPQDDEVRRLFALLAR